MVISTNTQLGLLFKRKEVKFKVLHHVKEYHENELKDKEAQIKILEEKIKEREKLQDEIPDDSLDYIIGENTKVIVKGETDYSNLIIKDDDSSYYLICPSVYKAAEMIKIGVNFTSRTLKDIKFGKYTYLMGKHQMVRFICEIGYIYGFYYDDKADVMFEWVLDINSGNYNFPGNFEKEFSSIMQILTFVELGDIEVKILNSMKTNGAKDKKDKIYNSSENTIFVVDSSWNQLIIRSEGFAVRGHFKLQPCGEGLRDRKLIWVDAFMKHGYTRKPKARHE